MGRASVQGIDALIVVVEPGARSIETASNIARMAEKLGIKHIAAVMNKITEAGQVETIRSKLTNIPVLANIAYNPAVQQADLVSQPVIKADAGLVEELSKAKNRLTELIGREAKVK